VLDVSPEIQIPLRELRFEFVRSAGAGGQNVNKVNTKAVLRWNLAGSRHLPEAVRSRFLVRYRRRVNAEGELVLTSDRFRSQGRNIADCLERLRALLLTVAKAPRPRRPTKPTRGARERRLEGKRQRSQTKQHRRKPGHDD